MDEPDIRDPDLIRQDAARKLHGMASIAELDGDELGYLLGRVAGLKRPQ